MENIIVTKSYEFAVKIVKLYKNITNSFHEYVLSKQILKSGTSIGANICEAIRAQSRADFAAKMSISLKEASETEYWLKLLHRTEYISTQRFEELKEECTELLKMLTVIVRKTNTKYR